MALESKPIVITKGPEDSIVSAIREVKNRIFVSWYNDLEKNSSILQIISIKKKGESYKSEYLYRIPFGLTKVTSMLDIFDGKMLVFTHGSIGNNANNERTEQVKITTPVSIVHLEAEINADNVKFLP